MWPVLEDREVDDPGLQTGAVVKRATVTAALSPVFVCGVGDLRLSISGMGRGSATLLARACASGTDAASCSCRR